MQISITSTLTDEQASLLAKEKWWQEMITIQVPSEETKVVTMPAMPWIEQTEYIVPVSYTEQVVPNTLSSGDFLKNFNRVLKLTTYTTHYEEHKKTKKKQTRLSSIDVQKLVVTIPLPYSLLASITCLLLPSDIIFLIINKNKYGQYYCVRDN